MKRKLLSIIAFSLASVTSFAQFWLPASSENYSVYDFNIVNENLVWGWQGFGYSSTLFKFQNVNGEWISSYHNSSNSNFPQEFRTSGISAISADAVFVIGTADFPNKKMFKTTDGGASWTQDSYDWHGQLSGFSHIHFFNENEGVVIGYDSEYLKMFTTSNSGQTWANSTNIGTIPMYNETPLDSNDRNHFTAKRDNSVVFVTTRTAGNTSADLGKVSRILKSDDKGNTWYVLFDFSQNEELGLRQFGNIDIKDNNTIYFTAYSTTLAKDLILYTTDNGTTLNYFAVEDAVGVAPFNHYHFTGGDPMNDSNSKSYFSKISTVPGSNMLVYSAVGGIDLDGENYSVTKYALNNHANASSWVTISNELLHDIDFLSPTIGFASNTLIDFPALYIYNSDFMSIKEFSQNPIQIFPNPSKNILNFSENLFNVEIYSASGNKLIQANNIKQLNTENLLPGTYFIKAVNEKGGKFNSKFLKQ